MLTTIAIVALISIFPLLGAWHARRFKRADGLIGLFVVFAALSQIMAAKIAVFDVGTG